MTSEAEGQDVEVSWATTLTKRVYGACGELIDSVRWSGPHQGNSPLVAAVQCQCGVDLWCLKLSCGEEEEEEEKILV